MRCAQESKHTALQAQTRLPSRSSPRILQSSRASSGAGSLGTGGLMTAPPVHISGNGSGGSLKLVRAASVVRCGGSRLERMHDALGLQLVCDEAEHRETDEADGLTE